jgi:hypothetical protein
MRKLTTIGAEVLRIVAAVESRGGTYMAGGKSRRAANAKLVRDGYLMALPTGGHTLTENGRSWATSNI